MNNSYTDDILWRVCLKDGKIVNEGDISLTLIPVNTIGYFELLKDSELIERIDLGDKHIQLIFTRRRIVSESICETIIIVGWQLEDVKEITWIYPDGTSETEEEWGTDVIHSKVTLL